ncbi:transposase domain-containing protein [Mesorhizobium sp. AaZ16]|uniref:transposase domain-containing protein n=1 Tax=Mesorhizobium sp. AaZ16 TaxID=3402289 RepID=UPI00374E4DF3
MTLIETAKLCGLNPHDCLADALGRINDHEINRLDDFCPGTGSPWLSLRIRRPDHGGDCARTHAGSCRRTPGRG